MKKMKRLLAAVLSLTLALGMAACGTTTDVRPDPNSQPASSGTASGSDGQEPPAASADTINILISAEPVTLNMLTSDSNLDTHVFYLTSAMLFRSIDTEVVPELCENLTLAEDNVTYTYTIKDAKYSDGTPITADDFVYYLIKGYLNGENCAQFKGGEETFNNSLDTCEGIYAVDDKTFVVTLAEPITTFDGFLEIYPVNKAFAESKGDAYGGTPADLQYSGPYILDAWTVGSSLTLHKNPDYINADTSFPIEKVNLMYASDVSTIYSMYANGEVDAIVSVSTALTELIGAENCYKYVSGNLIGLEFNTTGFTYKEGDGFTPRGEAVQALLQNKNFRMALCWALDREAMCTAVDPSSTPYNRYVDPSYTGTGDQPFVEEFPLSDVIPMKGDTAKAKEYLAAALEDLGYADVSELPKITFLTFENPVQRGAVETCVSIWKSELGLENIEINLQPIQSAIMSMVYMDYDIYLQQLSLKGSNMLELLGYWETAGSVSDPAGFQASGAPSFMTSMHANEEYDALVESCYKNFDDASRFADIAKAEQMLYSDYVYFPLWAGGGMAIEQDYVHGFVNPYLEDGYGLAHTIIDAH